MRERASIIHAIQCAEAFAKLFSSHTTPTPTPAPAPMTAERLDQCAWLIECRIGPESTYIQLKSREELSQEWEEEIHARGYDATKKLKPWHFTKDASSATRFAREEDAARAMVALGVRGPTGLLGWLRPTEHMWSDAAHPDVSNVPALTARVSRLLEAVEGMEKAIEPFRGAYDVKPPTADKWPDDKPLHECLPGIWPTWGDLKRLRESLATLRAAREGAR